MTNASTPSQQPASPTSELAQRLEAMASLAVQALPLDALPKGLRSGIDIVQISRIRDSLASFGTRFAQRMFTPAEIDYAMADEALAPERLAARFAAKEAAIKAFGLSHAGVDWREIEVVRENNGQCRLRLHGKAARVAGTDCGRDTSLSLSHDGDYAVAVVFATAASSDAAMPTSSITNSH